MPDDIKRASLFHETWNAIKASRKVWDKWVLGFGVLGAAVQCVLPMPVQSGILKQIHENPQLLKDHPEMASQMMQATFDNVAAMIPLMLIDIVLYTILFYILLVSYLRFAMTAAQPNFSVQNFAYWFGRVLWKYVRPILWCLIPFIGALIYLRSLIRYALVSPMAVLGRGPELPKSWELTEGNWWRIFLNQLGLSLVVGLIIWLVALLPIIVLAIAAHGDMQSPLYYKGLGVFRAFSMSIGVMVGAIFSCTAYRVLLKERKQAAPKAA